MITLRPDQLETVDKLRHARTERKPLPMGKRFGRMTVVSAGRPLGYECLYEYDFRCDCGALCSRPSRYIRRSSVPSCGCYESEAKAANGAKNRRHGMATQGTLDRRLYDVYRQMIRRCYDPKCKDFPAWGGRGIAVCEPWKSSVLIFSEWAKGSGYRAGVTIERQDNDQGYSPDNCTWIPNAEQARNTRRIRWLEFNGKRQSVADWARETGMPYRRIMARLNMGWSIERVFES